MELAMEEEGIDDIADAVGETGFSAPFLQTHDKDERRQRLFDYYKSYVHR
jgi:hypothetical protein